MRLHGKAEIEAMLAAALELDAAIAGWARLRSKKPIASKQFGTLRVRACCVEERDYLPVAIRLTVMTTGRKSVG